MFNPIIQPWRIVALVTIMAAGLLAARPVAAQQGLPEGTIRLIVSAPVGGGTDIIARLVAAELQDELKRPFVVESRPGASSTIASQLVRRARPDGTTLLVTYDAYVVDAAVHHDRHRLDLRPIIEISSAGPLLLTRPNGPAKTLQGLIDWARGYKGNINVGAPNADSPGALAADAFARMAGIKAETVNGAGSAGTLTGMLSGQFQYGFASATSVQGLLKSGDLVALGVATPHRLPSMPDVPAIAEALPGFNFTTWYGVFGPPKLPTAVVTALNQAISKAVRAPRVHDGILRQAGEPIAGTPEAFARLVQADFDRYSKVLASRKATP